MSPRGTEVICFGLDVRSTPSKVHIFNYSINELIAKWTLMRWNSFVGSTKGLAHYT